MRNVQRSASPGLTGMLVFLRQLLVLGLPALADVVRGLGADLTREGRDLASLLDVIYGHTVT